MNSMEKTKIINRHYSRQKTQVEVDDNVTGEYKIDTQVKFKTTMLKLNLYVYCDGYIIVKGTRRITGAGADVAAQKSDKINT